jgi:predicted RNA-binding Zn-ribbon protein involved in translation (DUF1610 family)
MTRIRATCPSCGEVELRPGDVALRIIRDHGQDRDHVGDGSTYRFECPDCDDLVTKPADARIVRLLETGGVQPKVDSAPRAKATGPKFTLNDLIDFHFALRDADVVALASLAEGSHVGP